MWPKSHNRKRDEREHRKTANQPDFGHGFKDFWGKINIAFTEYSLLVAIVRPHSEGTSEGTGTGKMTFWNQITFYASALREFVAPTYRPERHYMRGPGPAYARRHRGSFETPATFH
jgi:hypothetical protein